MKKTQSRPTPEQIHFTAVHRIYEHLQEISLTPKEKEFFKRQEELFSQTIINGKTKIDEQTPWEKQQEALEFARDWSGLL